MQCDAEEVFVWVFIGKPVINLSATEFDINDIAYNQTVIYIFLFGSNLIFRSEEPLLLDISG